MLSVLWPVIFIATERATWRPRGSAPRCGGSPARVPARQPFRMHTLGALWGHRTSRESIEGSVALGVMVGRSWRSLPSEDFVLKMRPLLEAHVNVGSCPRHWAG